METSGSVNKTAVIIIPTYNEAENISNLLPILTGKISSGLDGWTLKIVVVDGNSTDGTPEVVEKLILNNQNIHLIKEGRKGGLGQAYITSFKYAIHNLSADVVIEFDADFQHPPETIPALLNKIDEGFDCVMGSRTIRGGGESDGRNLWRSFLTKIGGLVARLILFFPGQNFSKVTDPTSGLRATRTREVLAKLNLEPSHYYSLKFGYKIQFLAEILATGARYAEIPLLFQNRRSGQSKFELGTVWDVLVTCLKTRWEERYFKVIVF